MTHSERVISFDGKNTDYAAHPPKSISLGGNIFLTFVNIFVNCFLFRARSASDQL